MSRLFQNQKCTERGFTYYVPLFILLLCLVKPVLLPAQQSQKISQEIAILKDSLSILSLFDVISKDTDKLFSPYNTTAIDNKSKTYWFRLSIRSENKDTSEWILKLPPYMDTAELFSPFAGGFKRLVTGSNIPFTNWPVAYSETPCLFIPVTDTATTFYLRLTSATRFSFQLRRLKEIQLVPPDVFDSVSHTSRYFHGIFLGIMVAMIILNLIIYFVYRDKSYLAYSLFMITHTLWHLSITGYLQEFVFFNFPQVSRHFPFEIAAISLMSYILFSHIYLETKKYSPKLNRIYNWMYLLILANVLFGEIANMRLANNMLLLLGVIVIVFPFFMAIIAYREKYRPAIFFLLASVLSYIAYVIFVLMQLKFLPEIFITRYSLQCSIALQSLLFGMGLADRMNLIRKELEFKKLEKIQLQVEKEVAIKNILEKQNEELEIKVHERTIKLEENQLVIEKEREKSDHLLLNILPAKIAERLKSGEEMIAEKFDNVTVFFSDIVDFTSLSKGISPKSLVANLNNIFSEFDHLTIRFGLEKIKTIGDGYMCVCGLPEPRADHAKQVALFSLEVQKVVKRYKYLELNEVLSVRIGIHSGSVIAGVIGNKKFAYDLWGETVNTASRMESHGMPFKIQCSASTQTLLADEFDFEERGEIELKGIGIMKTYFLLGSKMSVSEDQTKPT